MSSTISSTSDKGAHFFRCDFQVHSPRDRQWTGKACITDDERAEYAANLIAACRDKGLDAIAITDHHDMAFVRYVRQAAAQETDAEGRLRPECERIVVFPGIELTLAVPCQAILLLDSDFEETRFDAVLTELTITPAPSTNEKTIQTERLEHFESLSTLKTALDRHIWLKDRYIIFPNVTGERKSSLLRNGMAPKYKDMPFVGGYLDGSRDKLRQGIISILAGRDKSWGNKRIARIQTSDNRREDHADLGKHSSWIKWASPTAEALRQACLAQESRISDTEPNLPSVVITSISVQNSAFMGPLELSFNPQYNALIGGRGTGKSTILEYLRWALCDQPPDAGGEDEPDYQARRLRLIENTLKPFDATVDVTFTLNGVPHQVRRASKDDSVRIKISDDEFRSCAAAEIRTLLSVHAYSQKQLSNVSVRLDELARFINAPIRTELEQMKRQIAEQAEKLRKSFSTRQRQKTIEKDIAKLTLEIHSYQEQANQIRSSLSGLSEDDRRLLGLGPPFNRAKQAVESRKSRLQAIKDRINAVVKDLSSAKDDQSLDLPEDFPEQALVDALLAEYNALIREINTALQDVSTRIDQALGGEEGNKWFTWNAKLSSYRETYNAALKHSSAHKDRMNQLKMLEENVARLSSEVSILSDELKSYEKTAETYQAERESLLGLRQKCDALIQEQCDALTNRSSGTIRATVQRHSNAEHFLAALKEKLSGSNIRTNKLEQIVRSIIEAEVPYKVWTGTLNDLESLANLDLGAKSSDHLPETPFLKSAGATKNDCEKIAFKLSPDDWLSLSLIEIKSKPSFEYRTREGEYIDFANASSGQQATVLLRTLLNQPGPPLLIDQPEEDLDNPVIQEIVEQVWSAKKCRQIIFVSHNANLVVNGDAELVAWCEYRKAGDQSGGKITGVGAIDIPEARDAIKRIIEGGEAAFNLRREKYGF